MSELNKQSGSQKNGVWQDLKTSGAVLMIAVFVLGGVIIYSDVSFSNDNVKTGNSSYIDQCIAAARKSHRLTETEKRREIQRLQSAKRCQQAGFHDCFKEICSY